MALEEFNHFFMEAKLKAKERNKLDDSQFGIPSLRKYPLTDEKHVLQAVRFFGKAPKEHKAELARNIVKRAKELNMDWENWDVLKPYLDKPVKEAYAKELHSTPEADKICEYLCKSVKYDNASPKTWKLKSPDELTDHNKGNCHDTAWYVFKNLDAYAKRKVGKGILFFIEYKEGKKEGGQTHSVCYEKIPGGICIIECSWKGMTGTFPYNNIDEYVSVVKNNWKFTGDNDKLYATEIKNTSQIHPGMTLSEYVFVAMKNKEIITESYDPTDDSTSGTSDFDNDNMNEPDDCYCEAVDRSMLKELQQKEDNINPVTLKQYAQKCLSYSNSAGTRDLVFKLPRNADESNMDKRCRMYFENLIQNIDKCIDKNLDKIMDVKPTKWFFYERNVKKFFNVIGIGYKKDRVLTYMSSRRGVMSFSDKEYIEYTYNPTTDILIHRSRKSDLKFLKPTHTSRDGIVYPQPRVYCYLEKRSNISDVLDKQDSGQYGNNIYEIDINHSIQVFFDREYGKPHDNDKYRKPVFINTYKPLAAKPVVTPETESDKTRYNDKGDSVPDKCPKCGSKIEVYLKGEPVYLCSNKECGKYYGTVPCNINESENPSETEMFYKRWKEKEGMAVLKQAKEIVKKIAKKVKEDEQPPCGNQNCKLCTWCVEAQFRDIDALPRPLYSPRDPALDIIGETIVKDPVRISIKNGYDGMLEHLMEPVANVARFYCHVNWNNSTGGHEFIILKIGKQNFYIVDAQAGIVEPLSDTGNYFNDINFANSFICRLDNRDFNKELFEKYNDPKSVVPWDGRLDIPYMLERGMLSEEEAEQYWKEHPNEAPKDRHFLSYEELDRMSESKNIFTSGDFAKYADGVDLDAARGPIQEGFFGPSSMKIHNTIEAAIKLPDDYRTQLFSSVNGKPMVSQYDNKKIDSVSTISHWLTPREIYDDIIQRHIQTNIPKITIAKLKPSGTLSIHNGDENIYINTAGSDERFDKSFGTFTDLVNAINADQPVKVVIDGYMNENQLYDEYGGRGVLSDFFKIYSDRKFYALINNFNRLQMSNSPEKHYSKNLRKAAEKIFRDPTEDERNGRIKYFMHPDDLFTDSDGNDYGIGFAGVDNADEYLAISCKDGKVYYMSCGNPDRLVSNSFIDFLKSFEDGFFDEYLSKPIQESAVELPEGIWMRKAIKADRDYIFMVEMETLDEKYKNDPKVVEEIKEDAYVSVHKTRIICCSKGDHAETIGLLQAYQKDDYWYIGEIYLQPEFRGKGIGESILKKEISEHDWLSLDVSKNNKHAIDLYLSLGFKIIDENDNGYRMDLKKETIQEGAWNDIKRGVNPWSKKMWFHVSLSPLHEGKVFKPRIPEYLELTKAGKDDPYYEDMEIPRVCFSPSIEGAIHAITAGFKRIQTAGKELYVYIPEKPIDQYKHITNKEIVDRKLVFDAKYTKECWITEPVKLFLYGTIVVDQVSDHKAKPTANNKGEVSDVSYKWHWQTKPKVIKGMGHEYFYEPDKDDKKKSKKNKPVKEEYNMSNFVRDPKVFKMFMEADEEEEKGDALDVDVEDVELGTDDGSGEQNQYDPQEVESLNHLISSEAEAISDYFEAAKNTKVPVLSKLYSDIGEEERFHIEQLLYAKSTVTGEKYEPKDPKVRKEYEELLELGMDEETAMTTAVDKLSISVKEESIDDESDKKDAETEELEDLEESFKLYASMSNMTALNSYLIQESMSDKSTILRDVLNSNNQFITEAFFSEAVQNLNTKEGQKALGSKNPIVWVVNAIRGIYRLILNIAKKAKLAFQKIRLKSKAKWEWIHKHGIKGLFADGVSLYFYSDKTMKYDVNDAMIGLKLVHDTCEMVIKNAKLNLDTSKYEIDSFITGLQKYGDQLKPLPVPNIDVAIENLNGVKMYKTKLIVTDQNEATLEEDFFGYSKDKYNIMIKEGEESKNLNVSNNIYNKLNILLSAFTKCGTEVSDVANALAALNETSGSIYQTNNKLYNSCVSAMSAATKVLNQYTSAVSSDMSTIMNVNKGLYEAVKKADESNGKDMEDLNKYKDARKEAAKNAADQQTEAEKAANEGQISMKK